MVFVNIATWVSGPVPLLLSTVITLIAHIAEWARNGGTVVRVYILGATIGRKAYASLWQTSNAALRTIPNNNMQMMTPLGLCAFTQGT